MPCIHTHNLHANPISQFQCNLYNTRVTTLFCVSRAYVISIGKTLHFVKWYDGRWPREFGKDRTATRKQFCAGDMIRHFLYKTSLRAPLLLTTNHILWSYLKVDLHVILNLSFEHAWLFLCVPKFISTKFSTCLNSQFTSRACDCHDCSTRPQASGPDIAHLRLAPSHCVGGTVHWCSRSVPNSWGDMSVILKTRFSKREALKKWREN